ncbi:MAG: 5-formyltetrahydrofolate cyclo-ligase [Spirochaetales bacterium]|nr:5-formyltetrahydrofolate cyclo-ligase [Spirochaetales bacterium]
MIQKAEIRAATAKIRNNLPNSLRQEKSKIIIQKIINHPGYKDASCIMGFFPINSEVNILPILNDIIKRKKKLVLPRTDFNQNIIVPYFVENISDLKAGVKGIPEPDKNWKKPYIENIDIIILPGLAFDKLGGRIGYGGSFYDRFIQIFKKKPFLMGVAFKEQIIDLVPMESHDVFIDELITD